MYPCLDERVRVGEARGGVRDEEEFARGVQRRRRGSVAVVTGGARHPRGKERSRLGALEIHRHGTRRVDELVREHRALSKRRGHVLGLAHHRERGGPSLDVFLEHVEPPPDNLGHLILGEDQVLEFLFAVRGDLKREPAVALVDEVLDEGTRAPLDDPGGRRGETHLHRAGLNGLVGEAVRFDVLHRGIEELLGHDGGELVILSLAPAHPLLLGLLLLVGGVGSDVLPRTVAFPAGISREAPGREVRSGREDATRGLASACCANRNRGGASRVANRDVERARRARSRKPPRRCSKHFSPIPSVCSSTAAVCVLDVSTWTR